MRALSSATLLISLVKDNLLVLPDLFGFAFEVPDSLSLWPDDFS